MNIQEAFEKVASLLPGAEKAKQLETDLAAATAKISGFEGQLATITKERDAAAARVAVLEGEVKTKDEAHAKAITDLKAAHTTEIEAKEKDVEKRANTKAAAIAGNRGLNKPLAEEGSKGGSSSGGESAFATYARLMSEGNNIEAAQFYAANAEEILKSRGK